MFSYILNNNNHIEDDAVRAFHDLLAQYTPFRPREVSLFLYPDLIEPVPQNEAHLQIIYGGEIGSVGHWICIYYINGILRVYDSLFDYLSDSQKVYVNALFPYLDSNKIQHPSVQRQPNNSIECGLFAISFATALALKVNPSYVNYIAEDMRRHLFDMLSRGLLALFPSIDTPRKVFGRPPANLFQSISTKKEKIIKEANKKRNKRLQNTQSQECSTFTDKSQKTVSSIFIGETQTIVSPTFTDNSQETGSSIFIGETQTIVSPTFTDNSQEKGSSIFIGETELISSTFTKNSQKIESPIFIGVTQQIVSPTFTDNSQEMKSPVFIHDNPEYPEHKLHVDKYNNKRTCQEKSDTTAKRKKMNSDFTQRKSKRNTEARRTTRQIRDVRQAEQQSDTQARRVAREDSDYRDAEQQRNTQAHRVAREDPDYRDAEQQRNTQAHRVAREDPDYRDAEQQRDTQAHRVVREDPDYRDAEQNRNTRAHQFARQDPSHLQIEQARNSRARQSARSNFIQDWDNVTQKYFTNIREGYNHPCSCCGRLWHKNSIRKLTKQAISSKYNEDFVLNVFYLNPSDEFAEFCCTCAKYISQGRMPRLGIANGLQFPVIPDVLNELTPMEERLVSPRHVFLKLVRRGQGLGYQHGLSGNVINVPVKVNNMVRALPRSINDDNIITVELKRKFCYKHGRKERVRPEIIRKAAEYLVTCDLFRTYGIELEESWTNNEPENTVECTCELPDQECDDEENLDANPGGSETLLDDNQDVTIVMAPGEGERPISLLFDQHLEELAFIKVHCGVARKFNINLSHSEITRSEISRYDRRAVRPDYLFTALKKQQTIAVKNSITTCLRKKTVSGAPVLACNVLQSSFVDNLVQHDDGYRVLGGIRNSPAHWESEKKKLLGMVRQFGVPSLFLTLSAAEVQWNPLLILLSDVVDKKIITESEAENLQYETKARLIQADPFICATYFETKLKEIQKTWSCPAGPFLHYKITHYFYRIEFQHRGSPHAHMMLWLDGAPAFVPGDTTSAQEICKFVDSIISCNGSVIPNELKRLQLHKHTHTCRPNSDRLCRFGIPFYPMNETKLLTELSKEDVAYKKAKEMAKDIQEKIQNIPEEIYSFNEFLDWIGVNFEDYILAIRSTLKRPTVILQRRPQDVFINPFSKKILTLHEANMDIQFILDPFACAVYIVDYINKADRGMSRLLREALNEAKKGNKSIKESLRAVSNVFLNSSEISAQEAIYVLTGLPLSRASEAEMYINTSLPQERVHILKSHRELQSLAPDSSEIFQKGVIDYYSKRPLTLENMSLSYFVAYYTYSKNSGSTTSIEPINDSQIADNSQTVDEVVGNWIPLQDNLGYIRKRTKPRVIRFRRYSYLDDPDNFYREQLMLYIPWRNEEEELLNPNVNIKNKFDECKESIKKESEQFNKLGDAEIYDRLLSEIRNVELIGEEEDLQGRRVNEKAFEGFEFETQCADVEEDLIPGGNPGPQLCGDPSTFIVKPPQLSEDDFLVLARKLNDAQRDTLLHIYQHFSFTSPPTMYLFISGGAGVGKSVLIKAIYQSLSLLFNRERGSDPDELKIMLTAFTGKAAFGIGGQTIHSALGLPVSQAGNILPELSPSVANTLATKLAKLRLIVIDEISMLGSRTFHQINRRLQQVFHSTVFFAGISVIVVGDFRQLPPVGDNWVFHANSRNPLADIAGTPLWDLFVLTELHEIMRQKDDAAFATALNNMASGSMTPDDVILIQSRCFRNSSLPNTSEGAVHLYSSNREVDDHNNRVLSAMTTEGAISRAVDCVSGETNNVMISKALDTVSKLPTQQTYGLPSTINLKIGAKYMITLNIDTTDGLVNGTTGKLTAIDFAVNKNTGERRPLRIWVHFDNINIGKLKRIHSSTSLIRYKTRFKNNWTPIDPVTYTVKRYKSSNLQVRRSQLPLVPAEALTIHKCQGSTLEKVVVHVKPSISRSMLYVACSRATSAQGLFIVTESFHPPRPPTDRDSVVTEMKKLKLNPLIPIYRFLREPRNLFQIMFHNIQSLRKHLQDTTCDPQIMASDIYLAVETWTCVQDFFDINNFKEIIRTNGPKQSSSNPGFGVCAWAKLNIEYFNPQSYIDIVGGEHCEAISVEINNVKIVALYRSCKCSDSVAVGFVSNLLSLSSPCIIFGDFNEDYLCNKNTAVFKLLNDAGYRSLLQQLPSTRGGTQIDNIFCNFPCEVGFYNSLFSYHRPMWARF